MSKLIDDIRSFQQNIRTPQQVGTADFKAGWDTIQTSYGKTKRYRFETRIGCNVEIDEDLATLSDADLFTEALKSTRHLIADQVFGEFRQPLLKLRQRAAARGDSESLYQVDNILDSMFKV